MEKTPFGRGFVGRNLPTVCGALTAGIATALLGRPSVFLIVPIILISAGWGLVNEYRR